MIADSVLAWAATDRVAFIEGGRSISYGEMAFRARGVADELNASNAPKTVVIAAHNTAQSYITALGAWISARAFMPIHPLVPDAVRERIATSVADIEDGNVVRVLTSGTTGDPKVVGQPDAYYTGPELRAVGRVFNDGSKVLSAGPVAAAGVFGCTMSVLITGGTLHLLPQWDPQAFLDAMPSCDGGMLVPALARHIRSIRPTGDPARFHLLLGGAPVSEDIRAWCVENLADHVEVGYGSSEGGFMSLLPHGEECSDGNVGLPAADSTVEIDQETGEIIFTPSWRDAVRTGDVGYVDERGFLHITDRIDDMINVSGNKVWPSQIERVLITHPGVSDVVVGAFPDDLRGHAPVAFVIGDVDIEDLQEHAAKELTPSQRPREYRLVDSLPISPVGKVQRRLLTLSGAE